MTARTITCFKAYDLRGRLGSELDDDVAWRVGRAFAARLGTARVVVGRDGRESSPALAAALIRGLTQGGVEVLDLGLAGTEEMYFATDHLDADGGIEVTASHNPIDYNGMKLVGRGAAPLDPETELRDLAARAQAGVFADAAPGRVVDAAWVRADYARRICDFVDARSLRGRLLVNAGNGVAGPAFDAVADELARRGAALEIVRLNHDPDARFPNGIPNPLLPENQPATALAVKRHAVDLGVAWDGDFDRCFLFDETGRFVPGEYVVGLLAEAFLDRHPGARIVHDPRVVLNTRDVIARCGGQAVQSKTGHAFVKQQMRRSGAIYGGEMSAHHYFRDFAYADSGMIPWLMIAELMGRSGQPLSRLVGARMAQFPSSGEINFRLPDPDAAIARVLAEFASGAIARDDTDGISLEYPDWRFNLRQSNTEPVVRLNVESRGEAAQVAAMVDRISAALTG